MARTILVRPFVAALIAAAAWPASPALAEGVKLRPGNGIFVDANGGPLVRPEGVACSPTEIGAADTGNARFVVYTIADGIATPKAELKLPEVPVPLRTRFDGKDTFLALDGKSLRIARIDTSGKLLGFVPVVASGKISPVVKSFAVGPGGTIAILDIAGRRVLVEDAAGAAQREIALPDDCRFPTDVAVASDGRIFVLDAVGARVFAATKDATGATAWGPSLKDDVSFATSLAVDAEGRVFVLDQNGGGIVILGSDGAFRGRQGTFGWTEGALRWPASICADGKGGIAVADRENGRIATFTVAP
jgi:hypothetical protein